MYANAAACRRLGYSREAFAALRLSDVDASDGVDPLARRIVGDLAPCDFRAARIEQAHHLGKVGIGGAVHAATGGVPRRINLLCGRLMLLGAVEGRDRLDEADVATVQADLRSEGLAAPTGTGEPRAAAGGGGVAARLDELEELMRETRGLMAALVHPRGRDAGQS